jgi:hypothetical protein
MSHDKPNKTRKQGWSARAAPAPLFRRAPAGFRITSFRRGGVAGMVTEEFDEPCVHVYRMRWR